MKLLFITRKFPPMIGGMEKLSAALAKEFSKQVPTTLITWGKSQKYLPIFLPIFLIKALYLIPAKKIDHIHMGDALLSPLGLLLKTLFNIKTTTTVVGLDVTFNFPGYQFIVIPCLKRLDKIVCISRATLEECVKRGIPEEKCTVIPCGVYPEDFIVKAGRADLEKITGNNLSGKKVIITVGRLVKRKGVYWFIKNVIPNLDKNVVYLVIGDGPERPRIEELINKLRLQDRVFLLGKISDEKLKIIYNTADVFVMPNVKVPETIEGFGIVAVEASSTGLPVIASNIEGIAAAVINGKTGKLVESGNPGSFLKALTSNHVVKSSVKDITRKNFSWENIGISYIKKINN